jgi:esterase
MRALSLHYSELGSGATTVVLLHGLFGAGSNLGALARALAPDYRVISADLRNHGHSPHSATMTLAELAGDVLALLDALAIDRAHLVGHSLGGKVAMQLALNAPSRIGRLVCADIAPVQYRPHHQGIFAGLQAVDLGALQQRGDADAVLARYVDELPVRQFLLKSLYRDDEGFHWRFNLAALIADYDEVLAAPTGAPFEGEALFIKGGLSDYLLPEYEPALRALFPGFRVKIIEGTGHWLHGEKPVVFNKLVKDFLMAGPM